MNEEPIDQMKQEREAIERIAGTLDGKLLHRHLRRIVEEVREGDLSHGTLADMNGRRSVARNLMALMVKGIEHDRDGIPLASRATRPIRVAPAGPARRVSLAAGDAWSQRDPTDESDTGSGGGNAA